MRDSHTRQNHRPLDHAQLASRAASQGRKETICPSVKSAAFIPPPGIVKVGAADGSMPCVSYVTIALAEFAIPAVSTLSRLTIGQCFLTRTTKARGSFSPRSAERVGLDRHSKCAEDGTRPSTTKMQCTTARQVRLRRMQKTTVVGTAVYPYACTAHVPTACYRHADA